MISHCSAMNLSTLSMCPSQPGCCVSAGGSPPSLGAWARSLACTPSRPGGSGRPLVTTIIRDEALDVVVVVLNQQHRQDGEEVGVVLCS